MRMQANHPRNRGAEQARGPQLMRRFRSSSRAGWHPSRHAGPDPLVDGVLVRLESGEIHSPLHGDGKRYRTQIDLRAFTAADDTQADPNRWCHPDDAEIDLLTVRHHHANPARVQRVRVNGKRYASERGDLLKWKPAPSRCIASTESGILAGGGT